MEYLEIYKGQRVRHVRKGFTGTVVHLVDPDGVSLFGIKVDEQYIVSLAGNVNYHHGFYWAAGFNLEPIIGSQRTYYLASPMFVQVDG